MNPANWPGLNWKEIEILGERIGPRLEGSFLDRIIVPARPRHPQGYLKGEWALRFSAATLIFSVRPRHPYFVLYPDRGPQAAEDATRSPFDLALAKHLKGLKLLKVSVLRRERVLVLDFERRMRLALLLIPSIPEALLVEAPADVRQPSWSVIARSRTIRGNPEKARTFEVPDGTRAPENPEVRAELVEPGAFRAKLEGWLEREAFSLRITELEKQIREGMKAAQERFRQAEVARDEARQEPDWRRYGDLLKASIGVAPDSAADRAPGGHREAVDYATGERVRIPCDPKLGLKAQIEKFYAHSRRKQRRLSEALSRMETLSETLHRYETLAIRLKTLDSANPDWDRLERVEQESGQGPARERGGKAPSAKRRAGWLGRQAISRDGWAIWVGKSRDENLELTFRHARGNDLWMHVRGRPGAHVVVPVQPGKSVPLETLLDAANLAIYFSGGEGWGKTEVDYTFKKHVRRIKDSTEASYTHNKTLIVEPDRARVQRLLGEK